MEHKNFEVTAIESLAVANRYLPEIECDKDLFIKLKKILSKRYADLAYFYMNKKRNQSAIKMLAKSIHFNWQNVQAYKMLIASFIPHSIRKHIKRRDRSSAES
jgi:hypothetical protein